MVTADEIRQMPTGEKLMMMELLWQELSATEQDLPSPQWHADALAETEKAVESGSEVPVDWDEAKKALREEAR
jgi:hypothetical protein